MLKKAAHILIVFVLLLGTTGLTITRHYCSGNLTHTYVFSTPHNCCGENCPRCHNEKIILKITDNFQSSQSHTDLKAGFTKLLKQHSLPTLLAFSNTNSATLSTQLTREHLVKPNHNTSFCAGNTSPFLQVFLFWSLTLFLNRKSHYKHAFSCHWL